MNIKKLKKNLVISQFQFLLFSNPIFSIIKKNNLDSSNSKNIYKYSTNKLIIFSLLGLDLIKFPIAIQKFKSHKCIEKIDFVPYDNTFVLELFITKSLIISVQKYVKIELSIYFSFNFKKGNHSDLYV